MDHELFVDYYEILQVSSNADQETIERVFRLLAKRYHPDNNKTGNAERFTAISEAYHILSDPDQRAKYDARYESGRKSQWSLFFEKPMSGADEDRRIQQWILSLLYKARRLASSEPGMGLFELENYLEIAEGQLDFHLWYLKEKGWMARTESGKYAITADGVDWITERDHLFRKDRLIGEGGSGPSPGGHSGATDSSDPGERKAPEAFPTHDEAPLPEEESSESSGPANDPGQSEWFNRGNDTDQD